MSDLHQRAEDIAARLEEHDPETCPSQDEASEVIYALLAENDQVPALVEALKAIGEVAFVANGGDPWYCENEGIDTDRAYRLYREAIAAYDSAQNVSEARRDADGSKGPTAVQGESGAAAGSPRPGE